VKSERCTVVLGVRQSNKLLMEAPEFERADLSSVRWLISGGAPLPLYIIEAYQRRGVVFKQGYGLTEVGRQLLRDDGGAVGGEEGLRSARPMMYTQAEARRRRRPRGPDRPRSVSSSSRDRTSAPDTEQPRGDCGRARRRRLLPHRRPGAPRQG